MISICAWALAAILIIVTVLMHYEVMLAVSDRLVTWMLRHSQGRRVIGIAVAALMLGHIAEMWMFAFVYMGLVHVPGFGTVAGNFDGSFDSYLYFSAVTYSSLGANEYHPTGALRNIASAETLGGMMMIAWSASYTYLKMEQVWQTQRVRRRKPPRPDA